MGCTKTKSPSGSNSNAPPPPLASLAGLAAAPDVRLHPLRLLLLRKGISLTDAAVAFCWSRRKLLLVIHEWRRPRDAERVAKELGRDPVELFPSQ